MRKSKQPWSFGELCKVVKKYFWQMDKIGGRMIKNDQQSVIFLLYFCGLDELSASSRFTSSSYPSSIFNSQKSLPEEYKENISNPDKETECLNKIKGIFSKSVIKRDGLITDLVKITDKFDDFDNINGANLPTTIDEQSEFFLKCLRYTVNLSNNYNIQQLRTKRKKMILDEVNELSVDMKKIVPKGK